MSFESKNMNYAFYVEYYKGLEKIIEEELQNSKSSRYEKNVLEKMNLLGNKGKNSQQNNNEALLALGTEENLGNAAKDTMWKSNTIWNSNKIGQSIIMKTSYPGVLIGTGNQHAINLKGEIALGFTFDYVTGMPYLPGSSVKGILKAAFTYEEYIEDIIGDKLKKNNVTVKQLENAIFEGTMCEDNSSKDIQMSKRDIFYDAIIIPEKSTDQILRLDNITPHRQDRELLELGEPNPITMIRIGPDVVFEFKFNLKDTVFNDGREIDKNTKLELFTCILEDFGIGAKTNVGYGVLEKVEASDEGKLY